MPTSEVNKENTAPAGAPASPSQQEGGLPPRDVLGVPSNISEAVALATRAHDPRCSYFVPCLECVARKHREQEVLEMRHRERVARATDGPTVDLRQFVIVAIPRVQRPPVQPEGEQTQPTGAAASVPGLVAESGSSTDATTGKRQGKRRRDEEEEVATTSALPETSLPERPRKVPRRARGATASTAAASSDAASAPADSTSRPFACTIPGCTSRFKRKGDWKRHTQNSAHNAKAGRTCERCGKRLKSPRMDSLLRHYESAECCRQTQQQEGEDSDEEV